jgi:tetratricopeptide (TPR) repeat protein
MKQIAVLVLLLFPFSNSLFAQTQAQDEQLALYYFNNGEFDKAAGLYEKLYNKYPQTISYYNYYFKTLLQLKQYDEAYKVSKKQIKKYPADITLMVDAGYALLLQNKIKDAENYFNEAINKLLPDMTSISRLAQAFLSINRNNDALKVYDKARKLFGNNSLYINETAYIYQKQGDIQNVIKLFLDFVTDNPSYLQQAQQHLQDLMEEPAYAQELQMQLLKRLQKQPDNNALAEMLAWYYIQQKDYITAFTHIKSLDKRNKEDGFRVYQFANTAFQDANYTAATEALNYLIESRNKNGIYYKSARTLLLDVLKTKTLIPAVVSDADINTVLEAYRDYLSEFGRNGQSISVVRDYAMLLARYANKPDSAIAILEDIITQPGGTKNLKAQCKLDLGDYYIIAGNVWDATLIYMQVDKDFKEEPLGEEARFRNAKLSFYKGEFEWAQAQLDIIKGSTSELVSNDAIALSVFITDNTGLDTSTEAMSMYARADLLLFRNRYDEALLTLDSLLKKFPDHSLADDVLYEKALIYLKKNDIEKAVSFFEDLNRKFSTDLLADDALFDLANLYETVLNQKEKAMELYKQIITEHSGSLYVIEARKRYRALRGDGLN